ncbi:hypothetical protein [Treponema sp. R6D11]
MAKRGLSSDDARKVRQRGHDDALDFALRIGLEHDYKNDLKAKKDVIDPSGDAHSVKSGKKSGRFFFMEALALKMMTFSKPWTELVSC